MQRTLRRVLGSAVAAAALAASPAWALTPDQVFEKAAPSVWAIITVDAAGRALAYGSAVVIDEGRLVTNCHVLRKASGVLIGRDNVRYGAKLEHADPERALCLISVENFTAPAAAIAPGQAKVGERVYAIGNPEGLAQTLSEGLVSAIRDEVLQTSAPISPGSSGGGLFDDQARLVGITSAGVAARLAQNLNFAVPAKWIAEVPGRAKEALARRAQSARHGAVSPLRPAAGSRWTYSVRNGDDERRFTVRLETVEGPMITEVFAGDSKTYRANASEAGFQVRSVENQPLYELAPYLLAYHPDPVPSLLHADPYPGAQASDEWAVRVASIDEEEITVPAGTFRAVRLTVIGENSLRPGSGRHRGRNANRPRRFEFRAWYAGETGRYVRSRYQVFGPTGEVLDESVELVRFEPPAERRN